MEQLTQSSAIRLSDGLKGGEMKGLGDKLRGQSGHYDAEVNKGSLNMGSFTTKLNQRYEQGWRLSHLFEQAGNTVLVWERHS